MALWWSAVVNTGQIWTQVDGVSKLSQLDVPTEIFQTRVDEKGRVKFPVDVQKYLSEIFLLEGTGPKLFLTCLDERIVRIYPTSVWKQKQSQLEQEVELAQEVEALLFLAKDMGGTSEVDSQGRILVPAALRKSIISENSPVWLNCYKNRIDMMNEAVHDEMRQASLQNAADRMKMFARKGLL